MSDIRPASSRGLVSIVCAVLGAVFLVLTPPALWTHYVLLDTDRYVQTLAPLAHDKNVQAIVISAVDDEIMQHISLPSVGLQTAATELVDQVTTKVVESDAFPAVWDTVTRATHPQVVYVTTGRIEAGAPYLSRTGTVTLHLGPITDQIKTNLVTAGLAAALTLPAIDATVNITSMLGLEKGRPVFRAFDAGAIWFPLLGVVLIGAAVAMGGRSRAASAWASVALVFGAVIDLASLFVAEQSFAKAVPKETVPKSTAENAFTTMTHLMRYGILALLILGVAGIAYSWLTSDTRRAGPGPMRGKRPAPR